MTRTCILVLVTLACVVFVAKGAVVFGADPYSQSKNEVPLAARDFYVRFRAFNAGIPDKLCGGVRLNEKWVLTAAECLDNNVYAFIETTVLINKVNLTSETTPLRKFNYMIHAKHDSKTKLNNLALVQTDKKSWAGRFNHAKLLSKSAANNSFINEIVVITGYDLPPDADSSRPLYVPSMNVKIVEPSICEGLYSKSARKDEQFCAQPMYGKQVASDDIGAPVTISDFRKHTLVGLILSVSSKSGEKEQAIVIHKIAPFLPWLSRNTRIPLEP